MSARGRTWAGAATLVAACLLALLPASACGSPAQPQAAPAPRFHGG